MRQPQSINFCPCIRAGRTCQGYRDPQDMMFRDESQVLSTKRQRLAAVKKARHTVSLPPAKEAESSLVRVSSELPALEFSYKGSSPMSFLALDLGSSAEEQATCFFWRNYVLQEHRSHNGNFQYLSDLYSREEIGKSLSETIACLGLVGLSNFWKAPNIMRAAQSKYNSALQLVSSRLRNVEEAKADQTLVAVMLLGLYETNTCNSPQSMHSWTKHITGAAALLSLRGKQQLKTPIGHHLFVHLRTQVITNCVQRHVTVPPNISEWSQAALEYETEEEAVSTNLSEIAIKYCNLRASMSSFNDYSNSEYLIACLCSVDLEYSEFLNHCPISFIYSTMSLDRRSEEVFSDHYHVYSSIWTATVWNHYRCVRILVNELIIDQISYVLTHPEEYASSWESVSFYESQLLASNSTLQHLCHDICASVPFYLGYSVNASDRASRPPPKAVSGNLLLWPLYSAAVTRIVSDVMRDWVAGRLRIIADVMGIRQAAPLAYTLGLQQDLLEWEPGTENDGSGTLGRGT
ncbi:hypothetical protein D0Z07_8609 [Hyphodiscus hymeniophilus]|uniref:Uncharacterized protein n=1 Tax=Hyphodiscus hymeniophilus TaxID=353542 RepID=A0A9P6SMU6_9HELO|nr:hypothetical protein D0Z07_8609 [Hyphodiscus hymeniophilus]